MLNKPVILMGFKHVGKSILGQRLAHLCQVPFVDLDDKIMSLYCEKYGKFIPIALQDARLGAEVTRDLNDREEKNLKEYSLYLEDFSPHDHLKVDVRSDAQSRILKCNGYSTPREIMQEQGETFFRELESQALALVVSSVPSIPIGFQGTGKALVGEGEGVYTKYMTEPESHEQRRQNLKGDGYILALGGGTPLCVENQNKMKNAIKIHIQAPRNVVFERILSSGYPGFFNPAENEWENFCRLWDERDKIYREISDFSILNDSSVDEAVNELLKLV